MTKETFLEIVHNELSTGTITADDLLICINRNLEGDIKTVLENSDKKILFTENYPRLASCCFSQVQELDVREIRLENGLVFSCEDPETHNIYELHTEDFLMGELRHVLDKIDLSSASS